MSCRTKVQSDSPSTGSKSFSTLHGHARQKTRDIFHNDVIAEDRRMLRAGITVYATGGCGTLTIAQVSPTVERLDSVQLQLRQSQQLIWLPGLKVN